ncbi:MAG TPA: hypothetical protein GXX66_04610, partial [Acholeplasmataceae bacterium]|nr:hypothetical protein [Acholeplasmataceae bacterium]
EKEAEIVKKIYSDFLVKGKTPTGIAKELKRLEIKTPSGKNNNWTTNNIISILTNEKYKGDALLQKTFTENYLDQTIIKNTGQIPQYYVENSHPAIIDKDMWELVQIEIKRRDNLGAKYSSSDIFASKLICSDCGGFYGKKKWHSNTKYERFVYQCNRKFHKGKDKCMTPNLMEDDIKQKFIQAYNLTMKDKNRIIEDTTEIINLLTDTSQLDKDIETMNDDLAVIAELVNRLIKENSKSSINLEEYNKKYEELSLRYERTKEKQNDLIQARDNKKAQALSMKSFLANLKKVDDELSDWNEYVWMLLVESATVHRDKSISFKFHNGKEVISR